MQEIQGNMDDVLSGNNLRGDEKDKRYFQLQNRYLALKEQLNSRTQPEEIITTVADLTSSTQDSSTTIRCVLYRFFCHWFSIKFLERYLLSGFIASAY